MSDGQYVDFHELWHENDFKVGFGATDGLKGVDLEELLYKVVMGNALCVLLYQGPRIACLRKKMYQVTERGLRKEAFGGKNPHQGP